MPRKGRNNPAINHGQNFLFMLKAAHPVTNGKKQMGMSAINNPNINSMFVVCSLLFVVSGLAFRVSRFTFRVH